ncbi:Glycosyltransferase, catalytic subunit of cellulose synthase and poly-beta-1,6-N-acetylglucosamine synthase [Pedobacter terrae]|uniref:Glycosyltransferase, catalytic subunit of cellulose synthase and poly-beta-1,6-N-acetylglucosamine synthase n=1 Tax=Pedobacter terrae TaxID=405671 RepID=A0A1G7TX14_9SPHI|nr:glycosyltransferase family 2 protein [Pedobacter terrae]SDG39554.1 Glycosyltransferase, catalytic subunit of cellulose synthase and poly-beta-1,6-N-acetylglucosamine synthase [Pedobacter terrae]
MELIYKIIHLLFWILAVYLSFNCLYLLFFAIAGLFPLAGAEKKSSTHKKIVVLFPTYHADEVIIDSVRAALAHEYNGVANIVVIADGLLSRTVERLEAMGAEVIEVFFEKSTKGKALLYAIEKLKDRGFEVALVLDVDNLMGPDCLEAVNSSFQQGHKVVQLHRTAKNLDTSFAFLDACNEEVNNQLYRKGQAVLGLSPALIGSGMAFDYSYFHSLLKNVGETIGEDKKMDFLIAGDRVKVAYLNDIFVYDEKVSSASVFTTQRTRWLASQVEFLRTYTAIGIKELFKGNVEFFNKTIQTMLMPRILLLGLLFIMALQSFFNPFGPGKGLWLTLFISICVTLLISIPVRFYKDKKLYLAIWQIPRAMIGMVIALFSIGKVKKSNLVTPHQNTNAGGNKN